MFITRLRNSWIVRSNLLRPTSQFVNNFSSKDDKSDEKDSKQNKKDIKSNEANETDRKESAAEKLNRLLASMKTNDDIIITLQKKVDVPKAGGAGFKKSKKKELTEESKVSDQSEIMKKDLIDAAKNIADSSVTGIDKKVIESELLAKLLGGGEATSPDDVQKSVGEMNLNDLIVGMKIDRNPKPTDGPSRSEFVRKTVSEKQQQYQNKFKDRKSSKKLSVTQSVAYAGSVDLFNENQTLNIFKDVDNLKESNDILSTWNDLEQRDLRLLVTHPPENYFQKIKIWTDQGKLWKFPINNEHGLNEENEVDFSEHIFLDQHLEGWCPTKGPIRHFMELVCVGLSKNPYITAKEKYDHIIWYRDYFETKKDILKDLIASSETHTKVDAGQSGARSEMEKS